ncbi:hypothetical protein ASG17_11750 [Brevundimonas sp. Leaf363]|uniref:hypothetical protein n=1 Tax=Brevundimonas sp. Leaf363 TaxID=1736353 RepID=UPI00070045F4|nr:hypothetical protein [Brevundimonas sp. Leaf363]KQS54313.1 hypothetical protein ASG17_11750 [Brevundimonas sp. Leaf363]
MAARLKVFSWSDGFHAYTVAASSRPKALAAWGSEQDLFQTGLAHEITEGPDVDAALKSPGEVIKRGEAVDIGEAAPLRRRPDAAARKAEVKLAALKADLEALDARHAEEQADLTERRKALDTEAAVLDAAQAKARAALLAKIKAARAKT